LEYLYTDSIDSISSQKDQHGFAVEFMEACSKYGLIILAENIKFKLSVGLDIVPLTSDIPKTETLTNFVNREALSDVVFDVETKFIHGHKCILSSRSTHFYGLLSGGFKESKEEIISLPDVNFSAFVSMLEFIYTDSVELQDDSAVELFSLANEYSLDRLKALCEEFIEKGIEVDNVAWLFEIADRYNAKQLKAFCMYFILTEFDKVVATEAFKNLSPDTLQEISKHRKPKERKKEACDLQ